MTTNIHAGLIAGEELVINDAYVAPVTNAELDAPLGVLIPSVRGRKIAYAIYSIVSLILANITLSFSTLQAPLPGWLVISLTVVGNLAAPIGALAIVNAGKSAK